MLPRTVNQLIKSIIFYDSNLNSPFQVALKTSFRWYHNIELKIAQKHNGPHFWPNWVKNGPILEIQKAKQHNFLLGIQKCYKIIPIH